MTPFTLASHLLLLGQPSRIDELGSRMRGRSSISLQGGLGLLVLFVLAAVGAWLAVKFYNRRFGRGHRSPAGLFREMCRAHQLDRQEVRVLKQLATACSPEQPTKLFLMPEYLDESHLGASCNSETKERLLSLRDKIFGRKLTRRGG